MFDEPVPVPPELQRSLTTEEMIYVICCAIADRVGVSNRDIRRYTSDFLKMRAEDEGPHD